MSKYLESYHIFEVNTWCSRWPLMLSRCPFIFQGIFFVRTFTKRNERTDFKIKYFRSLPSPNSLLVGFCDLSKVTLTENVLISFTFSNGSFIEMCYKITKFSNIRILCEKALVPQVARIKFRRLYLRLVVQQLGWLVYFDLSRNKRFSFNTFISC